MQIREKGKGQFHNRPNIALRLASVMLVMVCVSTWLLAGLLAKYTTHSSGTDSARTAKFGILTLTETGSFYEENKLRLIPGVDLEKRAIVDFSGSEIACYVFVKVSPVGWTNTDDFFFEDTYTGYIKWSVSSNWKFLKSDGDNYIYYMVLAPNVVLNNQEIIKDGTVMVSEDAKNSDLDIISPLKISFEATVVQLNGFGSYGTEAEHAAVAWESVSAK